MSNIAAKSKPDDKSRLSSEDWERAAIDVIAEQGVGGVAVEPLARRLGVTKGSFYWHFPSREALLEAALKRWELADTDSMQRQIDRVGDPRERLVELFRRTSGELKTHVIYAALLKSLDHPVVQPVMQRLSQRRIAYLAAAFRALGLTRADAQNRARLAYASYVGYLQLMVQLQLPKLEVGDFASYVDHLIETLIPAT